MHSLSFSEAYIKGVETSVVVLFSTLLYLRLNTHFKNNASIHPDIPAEYHLFISRIIYLFILGFTCAAASYILIDVFGLGH